MVEDSRNHAWVLPDEPVPIRLMNTLWADQDGIHDDLTTAAALRDWLAVTGVGTKVGNVNREELARGRRLRDALRRLAAFCTNDERAVAESPVGTVAEAIRAVNDLAGELRPPQLVARSGRLVCDDAPGRSATRALSAVAKDGIELLTGVTATQLRACRAPGCVLYFLKTHPRRAWCSDVCGNRVRAARHYQRVRGSNRSNG